MNSDIAQLEEKPIEVPDITPVFAPGGPIAQILGDRYRYRQGQVEMAQLVRQALICLLYTSDAA
ncbi:MAG: hypothetical protein N2508_16885, partial [Anaerolineae bacterium]|nr:hypothetical protein [Anaerolineae bacterium]